METQVDIIHRLAQRDMLHVIQEIFAFLDIASLRNCELVSKSWYFAIRNDKIWERRYEREAKKRPHFYRSLVQHALRQTESSEFFYKKLFLVMLGNDPDQYNNLKLPRNLYRRSYYRGRYHITFLTMNDKRIVVGEDYRFTGALRFEEKSSIIFVYDSFTLDYQCVLEARGAGRIKHLQLQGDLLFGSFYSEKSIYVWNLESKQIVQKLHDDISMGLCFDGLFHAAQSLLISCYNVAAGAAFQKEIDGDAHLIVRRIHSPTQIIIERKEHLPLWEINQVESDANFVAVSLSFGAPESRELQLRSVSDFQVIHRIELSPDYKFCAFHDGQLLTLDIISNRVQIKFWNIPRFPITGLSPTLTHTNLTERTLTPSSRVSIHCGHLIFSEISDRGENRVYIQGVLDVNEIDFYYYWSFVQLGNDNISNPRIPKSWDRLYDSPNVSKLYSNYISIFDKTQFLLVSSDVLIQRIITEL